MHMNRKRVRTAPRGAAGFAMVEVLASLLVAAMGVVAIAGLHGRAASMELEANQRAQALVLLQDMAERIGSNRAQAVTYVATDVGLGEPQVCDALATLAERDVCEWGERLRGAAATRAGRDIGAMIGARGCVAAGGAARFVVTVAWQGVVAGAAPASPCGQGAYGDEAMRRSVSTVVQIADLMAL
jgi:type IV pilus assembly protein PilV